MFARRYTFLANNCRHLLNRNYLNCNNSFNKNNSNYIQYWISKTQCRRLLHQQQIKPTETKAQIRTSASKSSPQHLRSIWNKIFGKYLLATNIISSGVLMVIGDIAAQEIDLRRQLFANIEFTSSKNLSIFERYDKQRLWRMFIVGSLLGPLHHYVYHWMDILMPVANVRNSLKKILVDQLFMSPVCILIFFYSACALENKCLKETNEELIEKFPIIYLIDWLVWPGAQYINFRYLDTKYRVVFVNVCTAIYDIFLSYMKHEY